MHADGEEEDAEQQAAEGVDHRLDGAAILGFRQQETCDEGAERHRQSRDARDHAGSDCDQQGRRHEEFRIVAAGSQPEQRPQDQPSHQADHQDGRHGLQESGSDADPDRSLTGAAQGANEQQERNHREVLGQQDGEAGAAGRAHHAALARQKLHHDRRRRQRKAGADHQGGGRRAAQPPSDRGEQHGGQHDLQAAQAEYEAPQRQQAAHRQLEADEEQQEDDAQIGDEADLLFAGDGEPVDRQRLVGPAAEPVGAEQRAHREISQDRTDLQARHNRRDDRRRTQNDQRVLENMNFASRCHWHQHRRAAPFVHT